MDGIIVSEVSKRFGDTQVLRDVSLSVGKGEFLSLVGPSGCGKTTLMRIIAGLEGVTSGTVSIGGRDVTATRAADRDVAMVFQNYALYPHLTVRQNIAVPLMMRRLGPVQRLPFAGWLAPSVRARLDAIRQDVETAAGMLGIGALLDRKPAQLSGGQRQRVALGRAIVRNPLAFLMDEPLSNLDAALRVTTRSEIVALHRRVGASTVYVTHDQSEAMTMSDRIAVMMQGELLQVGTPDEIYADPQDLRVARFIGSPSINQIAAQAGPDGAVRVGGAAIGLRLEKPGDVVLAVRPEDLRLAAQGLAGRVTHLEYLGESLLAHVRLTEGAETIVCRLPPENRARLRHDEAVHLAFDHARALVFALDNRRLAARPVPSALREVAHG
jgi:multiple sugar transport system ATP-binding protein